VYLLLFWAYAYNVFDEMTEEINLSRPSLSEVMEEVMNLERT
jgi:hypothetical protein